MTALIPEGLEPLAAWGPHTPGWVDSRISEKIAWVKAHIPSHKDALCAEFYLVDGKPVALVRYFKRDEAGRKYLDPVTRQPALEPESAVVPLAELPPAHLLKGRPA